MLAWQTLFGFGGHACVTLFICLSGFSLAISVAKNNYTGLTSKAEIKNYAVRRFLRIAPPYYVAILFVLGCALLVPGINTLDSSIWRNALPIFDTRSIILHVLLLHGLDAQSLYQLSPQFWSIGTEAQIYVWLPFVVVPLARWKSVEWTVTSALVFSAVTMFFPAIRGACLHYVFTFTLGVYAADLVFNKTAKAKRTRLLTLLAIGLQALLVAWFARYQGDNFGFQDTLLTIPFALTLYFLASSDGRKGVTQFFNKILSTRIAGFFGRISYSLYLVHYVLIAAIHSTCVQYALPVSITVLLLMTLAPLLSIVIATIMRKWVEEPFLRISANFRPARPPRSVP